MKSKQNPASSDTLNITQKEKKTIKKIRSKLVEINQKNKQKLKHYLQKQKITRQRLQQIIVYLRKNPEVAQRFQKIKLKLDIKQNS